MNYQLVNDYLTSIFNNVLVIEESSLRGSRFNDVSIKEMHTIDVIGETPNATPSDISRELMVTLGTVTTSLNNLERKGYVERTRSDIAGMSRDEIQVMQKGLKNLYQFLEDLK